MSRKILMWEHHAWDSPIRVGGRAFAEQFLGEGWEVAWLNGPLAPWNLWGGNEEVRRRRRLWRSGGEERDCGRGRLFIYSPLAPLPYRPYPGLDGAWFHQHSLDLTRPSLFRILEQRRFGEVDLLWLATGSPFLPLLDRLPHRRSLYRLSDESSGFPDTPRSYSALEEEALRRVDLVIATAQALAERAGRFNENVLLLPNGVDLGRFERLPKDPPAEDGAGGRRARVVYIGAIDSWFDPEKVTVLARALPEVEFHLVGPVRIPIPWREPLTNVYLDGPLDPGAVPSLLARCDVGIIPFVESPLTQAIHPVKLYEYCAAGLPVVASDLQEIRRIGSPACLVRTDSEWVEAVRRALTAGKRPEALAFASRNDWSERFELLMKTLADPEPRSSGADARWGVG